MIFCFIIKSVKDRLKFLIAKFRVWRGKKIFILLKIGGAGRMKIVKVLKKVFCLLTPKEKG
jgi:hypothetical protein